MSSLDFDPDIHVIGPDEPAVELLERRWFAALAAIRRLEAECELLRGVLQMASDARRQADLRLANMESLRDALQARLGNLEESAATPTSPAARGAAVPLQVMSAA